MDRGLSNYELGTPAPFNPPYSYNCPLNEQISYIPDFPIQSISTHAPLNTGRTVWASVPEAPTSVKHLYSPNLFDYSQRYMRMPMGTLYDHDYSRTWPTGLGRNKIIGGGHYKVWPLTNANIREVHDYTDNHWERPPYKYAPEVLRTPTHLRSNWGPVSLVR